MFRLLPFRCTKQLYNYVHTLYIASGHIPFYSALKINLCDAYILIYLHLFWLTTSATCE